MQDFRPGQKYGIISDDQAYSTIDRQHIYFKFYYSEPSIIVKKSMWISYTIIARSTLLTETQYGKY